MQNSKFKKIVIETFRPRTSDEYKEVISNKSLTQSRITTPWLYARALALGFALFAVITLVFCLTHNSAAFVTSFTVGALMVNVPVLIFFYELYPKRETGLATLFLTMIIGGVLAAALIALGYEYIYNDPFNSDPWVSLLWTGFWEELGKAIFAISAILVLKKKSPYACFLIGFAVGTGFSVFEDMSYTYSYVRSFGEQWLALMSVGRGLSCAFSHAPWTAAICWAFAYFKKPFLNFRFYAVVVASMVLHYLADVPFFAEEVAFLTGLNWGWAIEAAVVAGIVLIVGFMLKTSFKQFYVQTENTAEIEPPVLTKSGKLSHAGNLTAVLCAVAVSAVILIGCVLCVGETRKYVDFADENQFIAFVQDGVNLNADWQREYDENAENYSEFTEDGGLKFAVQAAKDGDLEYYFVYEFKEQIPVLGYIGVRVDGEIFYCRRIFIYEGWNIIDYGTPPYLRPVDETLQEEITDDDESGADAPQEPQEPEQPQKVISFFVLNELCRSFEYNTETGAFRAVLNETQTFEKGVVIALCSVGAAIFAGGTAAVITLKIKARSKND